MKKSTEELLKILKHTQDVRSYLSQEQENFQNLPLHAYLNMLFAQKNASPSECIRKSGLDRTYCYQIFSGKKSPSRDKALAICIGLSLDFEETQTLLKSTGYPPLYPRKERDSIIIFALQRQMPIWELNELLLDAGHGLLE